MSAPPLRLSDATVCPYLADLGVLPQDAELGVESAGEGNINYVRRVRVIGAGSEAPSSVVVKQARPSLERFPEYRVSTERIVFEHRYGEVLTAHAPEERALLPDVLHFDAANKVLVLEDVGTGPLLADALARGDAPVEALYTLGRFLARVHQQTRPLASELVSEFSNEEMRALHGEHIFVLPYDGDAFPVEPTVRKAADAMLCRPGVRESIGALRSRYYGDQSALVHGDVQAGNVVLQSGRPRLLDAEIAHVGDPAFDLGTALAHVLAYGEGPGSDALTRGYREAEGETADLDRAYRYAGVELLRRTLGAARIPEITDPGDPGVAERVLTLGHKLLLEGSNAVPAF